MRGQFAGRPWAGALEYFLDGESRGTGRPQYHGTCKNTGLPYIQEETNMNINGTNITEAVSRRGLRSDHPGDPGSPSGAPIPTKRGYLASDPALISSLIRFGNGIKASQLRPRPSQWQPQSDMGK